MRENGRNAATQLEPAPLGNRRAAKHLAYATFTPAELDEVRVLEAEIRALLSTGTKLEPAPSFGWLQGEPGLGLNSQIRG